MDQQTAADRILTHLRASAHGDTGQNIARTLGIPYNTVRRAIQDLRREGFEITYPPLHEGYYYLPTDSATMV